MARSAPSLPNKASPITVVVYFWFMIALFVAAQSKTSYIRASAVYAYLSILHHILITFVIFDRQALYYLSSALFDLLIIILISAIRPVSKKQVIIQVLTLTSCFSHAFGYHMWISYQSLTFYNAYHVLIAIIIAIISRPNLTGDRARRGNLNRPQSDSYFVFRINFFESYFHHIRNLFETQK